MTLRPLNDIVIIEIDKDKAIDTNPEVERIVNSGLIILPEKNTVVKISNLGKVLAKGPKCVNEFKVGDRVMFQHFGGVSINRDGKKLRMLRELEINAVIE